SANVRDGGNRSTFAKPRSWPLHPDQEDPLPRGGDAEVRNDASARDRCGGPDHLVQGRAIGLDQIGLERGVGTVGSGEAAVEADGPTVEEAWEPEIAAGRHPRQVRELGSPAGSQVEEEDLRRLVPSRVWAEVDERDTPAVGTDRIDHPAVRESYPDGRVDVVDGDESRKAAGRPEPPESAPIGAHEEDALLSRRGREGWEHRELRRHLEDHPRAIRQHRQTLEGGTDDGACAVAYLPKEAADPARIGHRSRGRELHDRTRVAVPAADEELLFHRGPPLRVGGALGHHVGERPDARARGGAGVALGAGVATVPAPLTACRT